jgi:hypothetical protein
VFYVVIVSHCISLSHIINKYEIKQHIKWQSINILFMSLFRKWYALKVIFQCGIFFNNLSNWNDNELKHIHKKKTIFFYIQERKIFQNVKQSISLQFIGPIEQFSDEWLLWINLIPFQPLTIKVRLNPNSCQLLDRICKLSRHLKITHWIGRYDACNYCSVFSSFFVFHVVAPVVVWEKNIYNKTEEYKVGQWNNLESFKL